MSDSIVLIPMSAEEARTCVTDIREHMRVSDEQHQLARKKAHDLWQREGWKALGYSSFLKCAQAEFGKSFQHVYRLKDAVEVEQQLTSFSPLGEKFALPETHARKLKSLPTAESRYDALKVAEQMASSEGSDVVAQRHIEAAVNVTAKKLRVFASRYAPLSQMVTTGALSVEDAEDIAVRIDRLKPQAKGFVLQHLVRAGGMRGDVLSFIGEQYQRGDDPIAALILQTVNATGCLDGTLLKNANMDNTKRALYEARLEVESEQAQHEEDYGPVNLTLWERDVERSAAALVTIIDKAWAQLLWYRLGEALGVGTDGAR
jgi:hypothetical protein